ncbi:MAG: FUSC family protein [Planctomycetes bacterium]|nr:FUSC family protein [Planctomycetota bacterium]
MAQPRRFESETDDLVLTRGSFLQVFIRELAPAPGRLASTIRATTAVLSAVVLTVWVGNASFAMCPLAALTECSPGTVWTLGLAIRRILVSLACALVSIGIVAAVPQSQAVLFVLTLLAVWFGLYLTRVLPVGQSGLRVVVWTLSPLVAVPLYDPQDFEQSALMTAFGISAGILLAYAAALFIFPRSDSVRARDAVMALLADASRQLRELAVLCRTDTVNADADLPLIAEATFTHITVLTQELGVASQPKQMFPELATLTNMASIADAVVPHVHRMSIDLNASSAARVALADIADETASIFERTRGLALECHWARPGDKVPEVDDLVAAADAIALRSKRMLEAPDSAQDDAVLVVAGFGRRTSGLIRGVLRAHHASTDTATAMAIPARFDVPAWSGRVGTLWNALSAFQPAAAVSAAASMAGLGIALVVSALFLRSDPGAAALGGAFVMQSTIGGSGRRGALRLLGTVLGAVASLLAILLFAGGLQGLESFIVIMSVLSFISSWIVVGSARTNYAGLMFGAAWVTAIVVSPSPPDSIVPSLERLASVVVSLLSVTAAIWLFATISARAALMESMEKGWRQIAALMRAAEMKPFSAADLAAWAATSVRAAEQLATTADCREQYAFERRLAQSTFKPVLATLAEQQRLVVLSRMMASGRFLDHALPPSASVSLDEALEHAAGRIDQLADRFRTPHSGTEAAVPIPPASVVRAQAEAAGCSREDVARLLYRREALCVLEATLRRAERIFERGFIWIDGTLHSAQEQVDGEVPQRSTAMLMASS